MRYVFAGCNLDTAQFSLSRQGQVVPLRPNVVQLLVYLIEHRERVLSKQELCEQVWPHQLMRESALESYLRRVRQAVGDSGKAQRVIQTRRGHGYRFVASVTELPSESMLPPAVLPQTPSEAIMPAAERRQISVLFCDLIESTALATQLDLEDYHAVLQAYQTACGEVVQRFDGHTAQLLGDALLVYFGWPQAHEDDAQRAVHTGLGMTRP